MKARNVEKIGVWFVRTAHRALSEICGVCGRFIEKSQMYVRANDAKIAHYRCAMKAGWKQQSQKTEPLPMREKIPLEVAPSNRPVKLIKRILF